MKNTKNEKISHLQWFRTVRVLLSNALQLQVPCDWSLHMLMADKDNGCKLGSVWCAIWCALPPVP